MTNNQNEDTNPTAKIDHVRELGKKAIGYERHLELLGKEAADSNLYFWMEGYMNSQNKPGVSNADTAKMAEEYKMHPSNVKKLTGVEASLYVFTLDQLTDFAEFHLREKMREIKQKIELMQDDSGREGCTYGDTNYDSPSAVYGYNQALQNVTELLSDLTKNDEG